MPFFLTEKLIFPKVEEAAADGLIAIGGDLSIERLLLAYSSGIFPWYEEHYPILWWSPDPRMVLFPGDIKISHSLRQRLKKQTYEIRIDTSFKEVIRQCSTSSERKTKGTWITTEMTKAYIRLHNLGYAHSFETWQNDRLTGGLYGVSLGRCFFGESMFYHETDASKIALIFLAALTKELGFTLIDVQQETTHLKSLGATIISRKEFLKLLQNALSHETIKGKWTNFGSRNDFFKKLIS